MALGSPAFETEGLAVIVHAIGTKPLRDSTHSAAAQVCCRGASQGSEAWFSAPAQTWTTKLGAKASSSAVPTTAAWRSTRCFA